MTIETLPFEHLPRNSIANNIDKINELVEWVNQADHLSASATGESVTVGNSSSLKGLQVHGESVQDGTPTPDAPVPVQVMGGKNLLDESEFMNALYSGSTGAITSSSSVYMSTGKTPVESGTTYTLQMTKTYTSSGVYMYEWDSDGAYIGQTNLGNRDTTVFRATVTTNSETVYIAFSVGASSYPEQVGTVTNMQLEAGSTATSYVPYGSVGIVVGDTATSIDLQENTLASLPDGTHDELHVDSAGRVWIEKRTNAIVFDGSTDETWSIQSSGNRVATASDYPLALDLWPAGNQSSTTTANIYTSNFTASSPGRLASGTIGASINNASYNGFHPFLFGDGSGAMTIDTWTAYLSSNPVTVIYQLATPQTINLGYIDPPAIPSGSTVTISASLTPEFVLEWWVEPGITTLVNDLIAYVDYKTEG